MAHLMTESEAAQSIGIAREWLRHQRYQGRIGFTRIRNKVRYDEADVLKFIEGESVYVPPRAEEGQK